LFGQVFANGLNNLVDYRRDIKYKLRFSNGKKFTEPSEVIDWIGTKNNELMMITENMSSLINNALVEAFGLPGVSGDADHIVYVADKMVEMFRKTIEWTIDFRSVIVPEDCQTVIDVASGLSETLISDIDRYSDKFNHEISKALDHLKQSDAPYAVDLTIKLQAPNLTVYNEELHRFRNKYLM
jgi:hypothetical protein